MIRLPFNAFVLGAMLSAFAVVASAAPAADLWARWSARDQASRQIVDHSPWDRILKRYVRDGNDGINRFAYSEVSAQDRKDLDSYIQRLTETPISRYNAREQFAYWVNLYNALTIQVILEHYPVTSIREINISPGLFTRGPWRKKLVTVEGEAVSLDDIEHRILRPIWNDPRIHYAVNCASLGCPNLQQEAFVGADLERQLDTAAAAFVNHPRAVAVTDSGARVSSIYEWFKADFGGTDRGVLAHLRSYAEPPLERRLSSVERVSSHHYDWSLNRP